MGLSVVTSVVSREKIITGAPSMVDMSITGGTIARQTQTQPSTKVSAKMSALPGGAATPGAIPGPAGTIAPPPMSPVWGWDMRA